VTLQPVMVLILVQYQMRKLHGEN